MPVSVDLRKCDGSAVCITACAFNAIEIRDGKAIVFENCTDCDACVRACPTHAIGSATAEVRRGGCLVVDVDDRSGIVESVTRSAASASVGIERLRADVDRLRSSANAIAAQAEGRRLVVLPHTPACVAMGAMVAHALGAHAVFGCSELSLGAAGDVRARRPRFGGIVAADARLGPGQVVATLYPRLMRPFERDAQLGSSDVPGIGEAPPKPLAAARALVVCGDDQPDDVREVAAVIARSLDASLADEIAVAGTTLAPDLCIAIGVEGSPETNAALRGSRVIVAFAAREGDAIVQAADYVLIGDVHDHARAFLAALRGHE